MQEIRNPAKITVIEDDRLRSFGGDYSSANIMQKMEAKSMAKLISR